MTVFVDSDILIEVARGRDREIVSKWTALSQSDAAVGRQAGGYLKQYRKSHGVKLGDALIAASAHRNNASLWTLNRKHYPMIGLSFFEVR